MKNIKTIITLIIFCVYFIDGHGQGMNIWKGPTNPTNIYIGSLMIDKNSGNNREKIKVEVFGGDYASSNLGTTTYTIGTRLAYVINKETVGGTSDRHYLKVYEHNGQFDVVIESFGWAAFIVKGWILDSNSTAHETKCTLYDTTGKKAVTSLFTTTVFLTSATNGNIGIGIENPKSKLDVNGTIRAKEVKIEATGWADFVFKPEYNLQPLNAVEAHINEYGHLPNIPTEAEVKENGVDVGDMQIKLLQKIEELTLYTIQLNKEIQELKKEKSNSKND